MKTSAIVPASLKTAQHLFAHLSPGSPFYPSMRGRHAAVELVLIPTEPRLCYAAIAYFTDDRGDDVHALVHRSLYTHAVVLTPAEIIDWQLPVSCRAFVPTGVPRTFQNIVHFARSWVQERAREGWRMHLPGFHRSFQHKMVISPKLALVEVEV